MMWRHFFILTLGLYVHTSNACDSDLDTKITVPLSYTQAEHALNSTLLNVDNNPNGNALSNEITQATTAEQNRAAISKINRLVSRDAGTGFVMLPVSSVQTNQINLFGQLIGAHCSEQTSLVCAEASMLAQSLWWVAGEYRAFADKKNIADKAASLEFNNQLDRQWRSYKDDTIKLWPQEVLLNSMFYQSASKGLSSPPSYKLLALRPSLGVSYLSDESHRIQPTINLDILGVYWWNYGGKHNTEAQPGRGISASLIWDGDDTAYGLTYHHNPKWSTTIAHGSDNDVVLSISFQLAHWLIRR